MSIESKKVLLIKADINSFGDKKFVRQGQLSWMGIIVIVQDNHVWNFDTYVKEYKLLIIQIDLVLKS